MAKMQSVRKIAPILIFIGLFVVAYVGFLQVFNRKFVGHTYDNGKGAKLSLQYYKGAAIAPLSQLRALPPGSTNTGLKGIVSPTLDKDKLALVLYAVKAGTAADVPCNGSPAFEVKISGSTRPVCQVVNKQTGKPTIYHVTFKKGNERYTVFTMLDYDRAKAVSNPNEAARIVSKVDLTPFRSDIEKILASVEPK